jgi:hypothetical protein
MQVQQVEVDVVNLHLGDKLKFHEIMELEYSTITGHFSSKRMKGETLKAVMQENFTEVLGYSPHCMVLVKGLMI